MRRISEKRSKPEGAYIGKESSFQASAIKLVRAVFGMDALVIHVPNGRNAGSARMGGFWSGQGVVSGVPDILAFVPVDGFHGLAIELKVWPNKPSPEQVAVHRGLERAGWEVVVCYGLDEVESAARAHGQNPAA